VVGLQVGILRVRYLNINKIIGDYMNFKLQFNVFKFKDNFVSSVKNDDVYFELFGVLNILVNDYSFFENYNYPENEGSMGSSSIRKCGLTVPVFPFIQSLIDNHDSIGIKTIVIEDDQIDKELVIIPHGNEVIIGIRHDNFNWYNGEEVVISSRNLPQGKLNQVHTKVLKKAIKESILDFLKDLLFRFPELSKVKSFNSMIKNVELLSE
jgi:hypothetical protein